MRGRPNAASLFFLHKNSRKFWIAKINCVVLATINNKQMERHEIQIDCNTYLEVEYSIQYGEEGTYDTPPSPSTFEIQRLFIRREKSIIEVTEVNPAYLDFQFKRIEEEIEEELMNR